MRLLVVPHMRALTKHGRIRTRTMKVYIHYRQESSQRCETVWNEQLQTVALPDGWPKGAALVHEERRYDTRGIEMWAILPDHDDFKNEKCRVVMFTLLEWLWPFMCFYPKVLLWAKSNRASMVPKQAIYKSILSLYHQLTSLEYSSGAEERFKRELCVDAGTMQEQCLHIWRDLQWDMNWKRWSNTTNLLIVCHTVDINDWLVRLELKHIFSTLCD